MLTKQTSSPFDEKKIARKDVVGTKCLNFVINEIIQETHD